MASPCASSRFGTGLKKRRRGHHCVVDRQIVFRRASLVRDVRAIRFEAGGVVELVQVPKPEPGPEDVVVQGLAAGGFPAGPPPPPWGQGRTPPPPPPRPHEARPG